MKFLYPKWKESIRIMKNSSTDDDNEEDIG